MPARWQIFTADDEERRRFPDLAATLAGGGVAAAPPNRRRQVWRLEAAGRCWFIKQFGRSQWKNRLQHAFTAPRASSDADRECRVTQALRQQGWQAPVPVAVGGDAHRSVYVCRALPGIAVVELLQRGPLPAPLPRLLAEHCGRLLAAGFQLPDLSADHVFVETTSAGYRFGVLDLHNGRSQRAAPPPYRLLRRVLRRWLNSVRGLPISQRLALRFAARLLHSAGRHGCLRALLPQLPPLQTHARYDVRGKSEAYAGRNQRRQRSELALLQRLWPGERGELVLDLPCGAGRLLPWLRDERGHTVWQADSSLAMLQQARLAAGALLAPQFAADALRMPCADRCVDGVVMFRFLHHLPKAQQQLAIREACRVARRFVVFSFFHPCSFHHAQRLLRQRLGRPLGRHAVMLKQLRQWLADAGFALQGHAAEWRYVRDLWLVSAIRLPVATPATTGVPASGARP